MCKKNFSSSNFENQYELTLKEKEIQKVIELYKEAEEEIHVIKKEELEKQNNKKWYQFLK